MPPSGQNCETADNAIERPTANAPRRNACRPWYYRRTLSAMPAADAAARSRASAMGSEKTNQAWGGRFREPVHAFVARFTASVEFDKRLYRHDITGSIAHATMLAKVGVLSDAERDAIIDGLKQIQGEIEAGTFDWRVDLEDVHMNIEARLTDRIGITGKKLHTGRSRNDQVATDIRLWLRGEIGLILAEITRLQQGLLGLAEAEADTIMPGFTHLQTAQ